MQLRLTEVTGNLFTVSSEYSLAHCVGSDFKMGRGIAVEFRNRFGQVAKLKSQSVRPGGVATIADNERFIYYLVTKEFSYQVATYERMFASLNAMRTHMSRRSQIVRWNICVGSCPSFSLNNGVHNLAMPRIGCGLDRLNWCKVKDQIVEIFANDQVDIMVFEYTRNKNDSI